MTTPTGAADERERLIEDVEKWLSTRPHDEWTPLRKLLPLVRADAETIRQLKEGLFQMQNAAIDLTKQLAAQSAELERVRKVLADVRDDVVEAFNYSVLDRTRNQEKVDRYFDGQLARIDEALAAPSAAGGEKEGS